MVFIHVPKAAGTTIERLLDPSVNDPAAPPDYERAYGWCPVRRVWLQHATLQELVDFGLLDRAEAAEFFTFAVVRNPFDRAVSDYFFLRRKTMRAGSFAEMLRGEGAWRALLQDRSSSRYRGDHIRPQVDYVTLDGQDGMDHIGRFEDLTATFEELANRGLHIGDTRAVNSGRYRSDHYSHFYRDSEISSVSERYRDDLERFGYVFDDRRGERRGIHRELIRSVNLSRAALAGLRPV